MLAAACLGVALLVTLRGYYAGREYLHMENNARAISLSVEQLRAQNKSPEDIAVQLQNLAFITQARVRVLNSNETVLLDTGSPPNVLTFLYQRDGEQPYTVTVPEEMGFGSVHVTNDVAGGVPMTIRMPMTTLSRELSATDWNIAGTGVLHTDQTVLPTNAEATPEFNGIVYSVSSTPYGFDLVGDITPDVQSDQTVRIPMRDELNTIVGYVELSGGASISAQIVESVAIAMAFAAGIAVVIAGLVGWLISRRMSQPLLSLTHSAEKMARGDLSVRVTVQGKDEFKVLASAFNEMATQVEATIVALRRFVADAAHELHTPLTALRSDLELAATEPENPRLLQYVARAHSQVRRIEALTDNLLDLSRIEAKARQQPFRPVDVTQIVREISEAYASRAEQLNVDFTIDIPGKPVYTTGDETQLRRAIGNLLDNAIKFTPEEGTVGISVSRAHNQICIVVNDTGIGIPADDLPYLFQRFHRGRNANIYSGSGLGLAITRAIVDGHHGQIEAHSNPNDTRFILRLPVAT